jgi:hypothetical protein
MVTMDVNNRKDHCQLEINDLIGDAVSNAIARRGSPDTEVDISALSDAEAASIVGGKTLNLITVAGLKPISLPCAPVDLPAQPICLPVALPKPPIQWTCPPIVVGLIALPPGNQVTLS